MALGFLIICLVAAAVVLIYYGLKTKPDPTENEEKKAEVSAKYSPKLNRFQAKKERKAAEARAGLIEALNTEQREIDTNAEREAQSKVYYKQKEVELVKLDGELAVEEARNELIRLALSEGMDVVGYLKVMEHRQLKQVDLQAREIEYKQDQEQISRVQQEKLELFDRASHRLYSMYEQRKALEASEDPAKDDKLNQLNYNIGIAERLIRGEQDRYLEDALGQETVRSLPPQDGPGRPESEAGEGQELIGKRGRGRPRKNPPNEQGA